MKCTIIGFVGTMLLLGTLLAVPDNAEARGWYWVCCRNLVIGSDYRGRQTYCTRCDVFYRRHRGKTPGPGCEAYVSESSALEAAARDNCPEGY